MTKTIETKRLTVLDLMKDKEKYQTKKNAETVVKIDRLGVEIVIENPDKSLCMEAIAMGRNPETSESADKFLVYSVMKEPNLKDAELQKKYGCIEPYDIVDEIFEIGEITELAILALEKGGVKRGTISVVEEVKN